MNGIVRLFRTLLYCSLFFSSLLQAAPSTTLKIGVAADVTSLDPHYLNSGPNNNIAQHLFDALIHIDPNGQLVPALALSWKPLNATTWEFKLRRGVKFHDGQELTAEDVVFSLERPATILNSPGPFTGYTKPILSKRIIDRYTLQLTTATAYAPLPLDISNIFIVSKKVASHATTDDFNTGKALVGTGPFRYVSFRRGESVELKRYDAYWGDQPVWDKVVFKILTNDAARTAALLSGDVDAIESVPTADMARLRTDTRISITQRISWRTLFWQLDQWRDKSPFVTDKQGRPLDKNPLKDHRVRQAISKAINRSALVERTLEGLATPAGNIVAPGLLGYSDLGIEPYDPEGAKKLLAEAGYPDGFALTLHGPNNRYINDEQVVQTVAQFLQRVGIQAKVDTMPLSVYFGRARANEFSMALLGWGTIAGDSGGLRNLLATPNTETGFGAWNWGKYSHAELDRNLQRALTTLESKQRETYARQALAFAMKDYAAIPLHYQYASWAMRKGLKYRARVDEFTYAHLFYAE